MKKYYYILPFLFCTAIIVGFCIKSPSLMSKEEFFHRHNIYNNSIIPQEFDVEKFADNYDKTNAERSLYLLYSLSLPEQYAGFYTPKDEIIFYGVENNKQILYAWGFTDNDIKRVGLELRPEEKNDNPKNGKKLLIAKIGENIYLFGMYQNCSQSECYVYMLTKKNDEWIAPKADLRYKFCRPTEEADVYSCDIAGGYNFLRYEAINYTPLAKLLDNYYKLYDDYVWQYIQRKKNN